MAESMVGVAQSFAFYNDERPHQSLGYRTPGDVYRSGTGGGALIVDKYGDAGEGQEPCRGCHWRMRSSSGQRNAVRGSADPLRQWKRIQLKLARKLS